MVNTLNQRIVEETFNQSYNEEQFSKFITELLGSPDFTKAHRIQLPQDDKYTDFIRSVKKICEYRYVSDEFVDEKVIDILVVKLKKTTSVERARTAQRNFVARYLNGSRDYQKDAALVAFISEDENENISPDWRFSFVQMNYKTEIVENDKGKKKRVTSVELTPAKRFSFLVGENEHTHTAQRQFYECIEKSANGEKITIEDLVQAFDIEKVSKEFFDKYKSLYLKMVDELNRLYSNDPLVHNDFDKHNINIDDFAKKTLGQLVFLYFIQKKGWLGVKKGENWGTGDKKFLRKLFDKESEYNANYNNFFNDILEHLFYEALASDRGQSGWFGMLNCRIPFLNGGLFEPVNGYEWTVTDLTIDNNIFKEIFDTFDLYNFTVKEDEPLEKEVAIDPEMLGKVFENLLPENIRKGNGAFYTPREIVHYMCQESLINYLYKKINTKEIPLTEEEKNKQIKLFKQKKSNEQLKLTQEVIEEVVPIADIEFLIKKGNSTYSNRNVKEETPQTIIQYAKELDKALANIRVCDPAIGSGAFPVGMMNEIVRARTALSEYVGDKNRPIYELKRNAIENSIYGVDLDAGAVDIAKLRFWLSLVVDEDDVNNIKPLPNLDYKIMQGNSLLTTYEGIDFDEIIDEYKPNTQLMMNLWGDRSQDLKLELKNKQSKFLKTPHPTEKSELKQEIENLIVDLVKEKLEIKAKEGKIKLSELEEKVRNFAQNKENRNFFPWKLFFADAFDNGGFDVVMGNPPYIQLQKFKGDPVQKLYKDVGYEVHDSNGDIYCLFYEKGLEVLKHGGNLCFITSNKWMRAGYGEKLREFFVKNNPIQLIDFGGFGVFDSATVDVNILLIEKNKYQNKTKSCTIGKDFDGLNQMSVYIRQNSSDQSYTKNTWCILNPIEQSIKEKIERIGTPLKDWNISINYGIKTGLNEAFIIDSAKKDELIAKDPKSVEIIRPILRGRDIKRYSYDFADKWLIYIPWHFPLHNDETIQGCSEKAENLFKKEYPAIYEHLYNYKNDLSKRNQAETGIRYEWYAMQRYGANYMDDFNSQIIAWQRITQKPTFCITDAGTLVLDSMAFISNIGVYKNWLLAVLNSDLIYFWAKINVHEYGDTGFRLSNQYVEQMPIPQISDEHIKHIDFLVSKQLYKYDLETEKEIQKFVFKIYDINEEEMKVILSKISNN